MQVCGCLSVRLFICVHVHLFVLCLLASTHCICLDIISPLTKSRHFPQWPETKQNIKAPMIIRDVECRSMREIQICSATQNLLYAQCGFP